MTLNVALAGDPEKPPVILLHGFPESHRTWRELAPRLESEFFLVMPDQRGFAGSDLPQDVDAYKTDVLIDDIFALADALRLERFALVGHDWGGIVAWHLAAAVDSPVERLAILNAPRIDGFVRYLSRHPLQAWMSSYVAGFQIPVLPEIALRAGDFALLQAALEANARPGTFSADELAVYRTAWALPGALTTMLNWYRALTLAPGRAEGRVRAPTLVVWGDRDFALQAGLAEASAAACDDAKIVHIADAGHWIQHEEPERVNALLLSFLRKGG
jgi:pimeloyl-ACP methyl ester carboxylesterase